MNFFPDFAPNSRKEWRLLLFQSNLRKQIRKLPKILNLNLWKLFTIIQNYSLVSLFTGVVEGTANGPCGNFWLRLRLWIAFVRVGSLPRKFAILWSSSVWCWCSDFARVERGRDGAVERNRDGRGACDWPRTLRVAERLAPGLESASEMSVSSSRRLGCAEQEPVISRRCSQKSLRRHGWKRTLNDFNYRSRIWLFFLCLI